MGGNAFPQEENSRRIATNSRIMVDHVSKEKRRAIMQSVRSQDTMPELVVRSKLHNMGYRFRLHRKDLAGKPDVVLPRHKKVIFIHGCFWHRHKNCRKATTPKSRVQFWQEKFDNNERRDVRNIRLLRRQGWKVLVIWQCQTKDAIDLEKKLRRFLDER